MNEDYFYLEDTRNEPADRYGDRLRLTIDAPTRVGNDAAFYVEGSLTLDGRPLPVVPFPDDPFDDFVRLGIGIVAGVIIEDVARGLDLLLPFSMRQVSDTNVGGRTDITDLAAGTYALRVVARVRTGSTEGVVRVAEAVFDIGEPPPQDGPEDVWLVEYQGAHRHHESFDGRVRYFTPTGQVGVNDDVVLYTPERIPGNYRIEPRTISTPFDGDSIYFLSPDADGTSFVAEVQTDGSFFRPPSLGFAATLLSVGEDLDSWVWNGKTLGYYLGGGLQSSIDLYRNVVGLCAVRETSVWMVGARRALAGDQAHLRRVGSDGQELASVPAVRGIEPEQGVIMRPLLDGGVMAFCNYFREYRVVRISPSGAVVAVADPLPGRVIDIGVNPYRGDALAVYAGNPTGSYSIARLNGALSVTDTYEANDARFGGAFERLWSADISAPSAGTRIWVSGQRKERQPSGAVIDRGAIGFIDPDGSFTLVQGGMEVQTLIRALASF